MHIIYVLFLFTCTCFYLLYRLSTVDSLRLEFNDLLEKLFLSWPLDAVAKNLQYVNGKIPQRLCRHIEREYILFYNYFRFQLVKLFPLTCAWAENHCTMKMIFKLYRRYLARGVYLQYNTQLSPHAHTSLNYISLAPVTEKCGGKR